MPRVLIVTPPFEDYLTDAVVHGLRTLLGDDAVEWPEAQQLYRGMPDATRARIRGGGFTLYGLLEPRPLDRSRILHRVLDGEFDLVVFGDIWRSFGLWTEWAPQLPKRLKVAVLDGSDRVEPYPYAGLWWRVPAWWTLPRAHRRAVYFKREIHPATYWFRSFLLLPPGLARRAGLLRGMRPIAFAIPAEKIVDAPPAKDKEFGVHVVDPEVAPRVGGQVSYAFADEAAYYDDLRRSRFAVTTKRAGWDALRHYEIAANGAVPCFRDLDRKPPRCAPHGLDRSNCVVYRDADDLLAQTTGMSEDRYAELQAGALAWARANTTVRRAQQLLDAMGVG